MCEAVCIRLGVCVRPRLLCDPSGWPSPTSALACWRAVAVAVAPQAAAPPVVYPSRTWCPLPLIPLPGHLVGCGDCFNVLTPSLQLSHPPCDCSHTHNPVYILQQTGLRTCMRCPVDGPRRTLCGERSAVRGSDRSRLARCTLHGGVPDHARPRPDPWCTPTDREARAVQREIEATREADALRIRVYKLEQQLDLAGGVARGGAGNKARRRWDGCPGHCCVCGLKGLPPLHFLIHVYQPSRVFPCCSPRSASTGAGTGRATSQEPLRGRQGAGLGDVSSGSLPGYPSVDGDGEAEGPGAHDLDGDAGHEPVRHMVACIASSGCRMHNPCSTMCPHARSVC